MSIEVSMPAQPFDLVSLYKDLHAHPELGFAEVRTSNIAANHLTALGFEVHTGIAVTGVVGVLHNGAGPTVLLRADMDGLPVLEQTGLDYASVARGVNAEGEEVPLMHACGHDVHVACLIGAAERLVQTREEWSGTVIALFQPAEEGGGGAEAMIADGLYSKIPQPDVVFGQHVSPYPAGTLGGHPGGAMAAADTLSVEMYGRGGHGSEPETTVDPVVMAAATVLRLQTIVSREISPHDTSVVTVGKLEAGSQHNIIADKASLGISVRSFDNGVRERLLEGIQRIIAAESMASNAPREPQVTFEQSYPLTYNEPELTEDLNAAFIERFGQDVYFAPGAITGSEDVGVLATAANVPLVYWMLGGHDTAEYWAADAKGVVHEEIPSNHSPFYAPEIDPTLERGVEALVIATRLWLDRHATA